MQHGVRVIALLLILLLQACGTVITKDGPPQSAVDVSKIPDATPKDEPMSRYGNPHSYVALGKRYYVLPSAKGYEQRGIASWYGRKFNGQLTSNRERYDMLAMTAASPVLPIPCYVRVSNLENGRSVIVRVNDRGPFAPNRIIDLTYAAAKKLGYVKKGTALVDVKVIDPKNLEANPPTLLTHNPQLYLQVGAFSERANAERLRQQLSSYTNKPIHITQTTSQNQSLYRVRIGPLIDVDESDILLTKLHQYGLNTAITVIG